MRVIEYASVCVEPSARQSCMPDRGRNVERCVTVYRSDHVRARMLLILVLKAQNRPVARLRRVGARRNRRQHLLHSAGRRPAAGFGRLPSCSALGVPAPTTPCSVICEQLSGNRLRLAVGGCPHCTICPPPSPQTGSHPPICAQSISWAQHLHL
jgi:hypothetical protein